MFYDNTRKRISVSKGATKEKLEAPVLIDTTTDTSYQDFKDSIVNTCDEIINNPSLTDEQKAKIVWLKSRVEIEM